MTKTVLLPEPDLDCPLLLPVLVLDRLELHPFQAGRICEVPKGHKNPPAIFQRGTQGLSKLLWPFFKSTTVAKVRNYFISLMTVIFFTMYLLHFLACLLIYVKSRNDGAVFSSQFYLDIYFFIVTTLYTVGYGSEVTSKRA